jgi:hypothetical protein
MPMRSHLDVVLDRLEARSGKRATWAGDGLVTCCPAHHDRRASLSVGAGNDGRVLVKCHAGCTAQQIVGTLGLELRDLFPPSAKPSRAQIIATYDYRDEAGRVLFTVERLDPKGFRQRRDRSGEKVWELGDVRRVLFRLPELLAADRAVPVYVVEGEKDAERLLKQGGHRDDEPRRGREVAARVRGCASRAAPRDRPR